MTEQSSDRIEKQVVLNAPRARVWRSLATSAEFGKWFGVNFTSDFTPGARVSGKLTHKQYEHITLEIIIEKLEPEQRFSFRWHPFAIEEGVDYSAEPTTLVEFTLEDAPGGTLLKVVESGFDRIPASRRARAFEMNAKGWAGQLVAIGKYLGAPA